MYLIPVPAFADNYLWLLHDGKHALVVDPGDAGPVLAALTKHGLLLESILVTHHHADHTGGVAELREASGARVYGPATERIPAPFTPLREVDTARALGLDFQIIDVPGHTSGHIAFYCPDVHGKPLLLCGDTLFSGGCGNLFEGTPAQMLTSLHKLAALPGNTVVCCTHEYTLSNLRFAMNVEPRQQRSCRLPDRLHPSAQRGPADVANLYRPGTADQSLLAHPTILRRSGCSQLRPIGP